MNVTATSIVCARFGIFWPVETWACLYHMHPCAKRQTCEFSISGNVFTSNKTASQCQLQNITHLRCDFQGNYPLNTCIKVCENQPRFSSLSSHKNSRKKSSFSKNELLLDEENKKRPLCSSCPKKMPSFFRVAPYQQLP